MRTTKNCLSAHPLVILGIVILFHFCACIQPQKMVNFEDVENIEALQSQYIQQVEKIKIQKDDILSITVSTFDTLAARVFNTKINPAAGNGSFIGQGYLVNDEGLIEFPVLGKIKVEGLTREQAKDEIRRRLLLYLKDPVVDVRFLNLHVTVFGEVKRPGLYTFPDEQFTILEALTLAGDLTDFADRANIMVIRESDNLREFGKVDLSSSRAFESPYFYLKQNDAIYIRPLAVKERVIQDPLTRAMSIAGIVSSVSTVILAIIVASRG